MFFSIRNNRGALSWHGPLIVLLVTLVGCSCSSKTPSGPGNQAGSGGSSSAEMGGVVPPEVFVRTWNSATKKAETSKAPNDAKIRVFNDDEVIVDSPIQRPFVEPGTRQVCYLAFACTNPSCASHGRNGRPFVFTQPFKRMKLGANGDIDWSLDHPHEAPEPEETGMPRCPICGSSQFVQIYVLPEFQPRLEQLKAELAQSRIALRAARQAGQGLPPDVRPPVKIQEEINSLPRLFLTREVK